MKNLIIITLLCIVVFSAVGFEKYDDVTSELISKLRLKTIELKRCEKKLEIQQVLNMYGGDASEADRSY